jgi:hypothetical protein
MLLMIVNDCTSGHCPIHGNDRAAAAHRSRNSVDAVESTHINEGFTSLFGSPAQACMSTIEHADEKLADGAEAAAAAPSTSANPLPRCVYSDASPSSEFGGSSLLAATVSSVECAITHVATASNPGQRGADCTQIHSDSLGMNQSEHSARKLCADLNAPVAAACGRDNEMLAASDKPVGMKRARSPDLKANPSLGASCERPVHAEPDRHCRQRYLMEGIMSIPPPKFVQHRDFTRILGDDAPRSKYRDLPHHMRTTNHWGQRKLFLSEVEFLTLFIHGIRARSPPPKRIIVVYAGAAPGNHIPYLFDLFDNKSGDLQFALYDPADWNIKVRHNQGFGFDEITLNPPESSCCNGFYTDDVARYYKSQCESHGYVTLFISDIRTGDPKCMKAPELEAAVKRDMEWQQTWIRIMRPVGSMLKFRLPWATGCTSYVKGDIYLPVWGPQTTTETRLIVYEKDLDTFIDYDHRSYEERMFFFNTCSRVDFYQHEVKNVLGIDRCYDCAAEAHILGRYFATTSGPGASGMDASQQIARMMHEISRNISSGRTLASVIDVHTRKEWFEPRQYDTESFQLSKAPKSEWFVEKYARPSSASASLSVKDVSHPRRSTVLPTEPRHNIHRTDLRDVIPRVETNRSDRNPVSSVFGVGAATMRSPSSLGGSDHGLFSDAGGHSCNSGRSGRGDRQGRRNDLGDSRVQGGYGQEWGREGPGGDRSGDRGYGGQR